MESKIVLATRFAPESCQHHWKNFPPSTIASRLNRRWDRLSARSCYSVLFEHDLFGKPVSTFPDHARQTKGKRNAGRRISPNLRALRARLALSGARSPVGVPPRLSPEGLSSPRLSVGPGFPRRGADKRRSSPRRRRPRLQRCTSRAGHSAGRLMPKPPGSGGDEPPPAGTALATPPGVTRPASFTGARFAVYR